MGIGASKPASRGIILSFDALGTLYRFRAPVANQYLTIAQKCGLKSKVELPDLEASFQRSYKAINTEFPNYGKGKLDDPEVWWSELVKRSFKDVVKDEDLPEDLGSTLYQHFSSGAAYELYPDVNPFLQRMHEIRENPSTPTLLLGIITNSDHRAKKVLESLSLKIGMSAMPQYRQHDVMKSTMDDVEQMSRSGKVQITVPWQDVWDASKDFDFLATSYDADGEKPGANIFQYARMLAGLNVLSKATQELPATDSPMRGVVNLGRTAFQHRNDVDNMAWIHVGDEYEKDYVGAESKGLQALHLVREGEGKVVEGAKTVSSLTEVASIVNLLVAENTSK